MKNIIRHGDLVFKKVAEVPKELNKIAYKGNFVLAEGEATGHYHTLVADKTAVEILQNEKGDYYISVNGKAVMTHPEHKTIELPKGNWKMEREKEKDWFSLEVREVQD